MFYILFAAVLPLVSAHAETVSSCVLDGGGLATKRSCGVEKAVGNINEMYRTIGVQPKQAVLTKRASQNNPVNFDCIDSACNDPGSPECSATMFYETSKDMATVPEGEFRNNKIAGKAFEATRSSFYENCLSAGQVDSDADRLDVCHFWTFNHANQNGIKFGHPLDPAHDYAMNEKFAEDNVLKREELASKAANCRTFRYLANTPFSENLSSVALSPNGRIIPNRCGVSASAGQSGTVGILRNSKGKDPRYSFNESMKEAIKNKFKFDQMFLADGLKGYNKDKAPSLDDMMYYAMTNGSTIDQPGLSSDGFMEQVLKNDAWRENIAQNSCRLEVMSSFEMSAKNIQTLLEPALKALDPNSTVMTGTAVSTGQDELSLDDFLSPAEKAQLDYDVKRISAQVKNIENSVGIECIEQRCKNKEGDAAVACGNACAKFQDIYAPFSRQFLDLKAEVAKAYASGKAEKIALAEKNLRSFREKGTSEHSWAMISLLSNYTTLWNRLSNLTKLVHSSANAKNAARIQDYLTLRRCELGAFDKTAPSAEEFMASRMKIVSQANAY